MGVDGPRGLGVVLMLLMLSGVEMLCAGDVSSEAGLPLLLLMLSGVEVLRARDVSSEEGLP